MQNRTLSKQDYSLLNKYLTEAIKTERSDVFQTSFANSFSYYDLKMDAKDKFEILGKVVRKIRICISIEKSSCLTISFTNGSKLTTSVTNPEFIEYFKKISQPNHMFAQMGEEPLEWEHKTVSDLYEYSKHLTPTENYEIIHGEIIIGIYRIYHKKNLALLNIIDGGCGNGKFLKYYEQRNVVDNVKLLGFDFNSKNIEECKNEYKGDCHFREGNLLELQKIIREGKEAKSLHREAPTILILSGTLTRLVLKNAFEAVQILQQAMNEKIDYIIGGGQTTPLINPFIAKRVGLKPYMVGSSFGARNFFFYQRMSQTEILQNKINKIKKRNMLDLSLAPNPAQLIKTLDNTHYIRDGLTIDLSFCALTRELIESLNEISKKYVNIKLIFWHWDKSVVDQFSDCFSGKFEISVNVVKDESYLMAPRAFFTEVQTNLCLFPAKKTTKVSGITYDILTPSFHN